MPTLDFKGKAFVYAHHLTVPYRSLFVDEAKSLPPAGQKPSLDDNLIIHGDNLHALKALLPTYAGKVDCIYIDPPYNTGNEGWCYNDNVNGPLMQAWLAQNSPVDKEDLERHDKWLCMMWPRLQLLRELLSEDGVIFISIDDNEIHRLRCIMDDIFGEDRFYAHLVWQKKYSAANDHKGISPMHDHILVYRQSESFSRNLLERTEGNNSQYRFEDESGIFRLGDYTCNKTANERPNLYYPIVNPNTGKSIYPNPSRVWRCSQATHEHNAKQNLVWWGADGKSEIPSFKRYLNNLRNGGGTVPTTWWDWVFAGHTDEAKKDLRAIGAGADSDQTITPKPAKLIRRILEIATDENSIVLDSFAGSGTTAQAVLELNRKDGGNRKFILCECEDYADRLTAERVRRVINGYEFEGTTKEELLSEPVTFTTLKKSAQLLEKVAEIEAREKARFDKISKTVKDGVLKVVGEKKVTERTDGTGGSFTFVTLGPPMDIETMLVNGLPDYACLAKHVFYTATGATLDTVPEAPGPDGDWYIGETPTARLHLIYQASRDWLRSDASALTASLADHIAKHKSPGKRCIVFAALKYISQKELTTAYGIEFCQLPYAIHRLEGDSA